MTSRGMRHWSSGAIPLIAPEALSDIIAASSDVAIVVTPEGRVRSVLTGGPTASGAAIGPLDHWVGADLRRHLTSETVPKLDAALAAVASGRGALRPVELNHTDAATPEMPVRYTFHRVGQEGAVLMLGRDLRPVAEMQQRLVNAQMTLERDYEAGRALETRYRVLLASVGVPIAFVAVASGRIADLNAPAAGLLGAGVSDLTGASLAGEMEGRRRGELMEALGAAAEAGAAPLAARARRTGEEVALHPVLFRSGGERFALVRLARPASADEDGPADDAMARLFASGVDAMVVTDARGAVERANESFLALVEAGGAGAVEGRSLAEFLARGSADLRVLTEAAAREGALRLYAAALVTEFDGRVPVEISATALGAGEDGAAPEGFAFVIRDAARAGALRGEAPPDEAGLGDAMARSVTEMVGAAPLRDIVAETSDAVERLCIRTAVELTGNNRVAAAEMLGLSRQSLYVKLHKHGLASKDGEA